MSILRFSSPEDGIGHRATSARMGKKPRRAAFTLIELLVVVAIISLLMSILLPSLRKAREQAKATVCGANLRSRGEDMTLYFTDNRDWIPGVNTTGLANRELRQTEPDPFQYGEVPVQPFDWMTPTVSLGTELPHIRAERFALFLNKYACPSQMEASVAYTQGQVPDMEEFFKVPSWTAVSYLMPVSFQYWGDDDKYIKLGYYRDMPVPLPVYAISAPENYDKVRIARYRSRVNRVGTPAGKIMVADGTRFLDEDLRMDHDIAVRPQHFGAFGSSGAWWGGSTAYGVKAGTTNWDDQTVNYQTPGRGQNLAVSYRHGTVQRGAGSCQSNTGQINAMFYDIHVERMTDKLSRKIDYWYPRGAEVVNNSDGMTDVEVGYIIR